MDDEVAADSEDVGIPDTSRFKSILSTRSLLPLISTLNEKPRPLGWVAGATTDDDEVQ
jgi:hypothetical protein